MFGKALLILAVLTVCTAWNPWTNRIGSRTFSASRRRVSSARGNAATTSVAQGYFKQLIDHTNGNDTFTQRFAFTKTFATGKKVAFLYISGQEQLEPTLLENENIPFVKFARQYGATVFSLEHRFYGQSQPFNTLSTANLKTLTSAQAVADVAEFIRFANKQYELDKGVRWVLFGANIGGLIAAQARARYPDLVAGVIASSTPIDLKMDFWEYNDQIEQSIWSYGGQNCAGNISIAFTALANNMNTPEGRATISKTLNLLIPLEKTPLGYNDIQSVYAAAIQTFQIIVEFNNEFGVNITQMCNIMENTKNDPLQKIYNVYLLFQDPTSPLPMENDYNATILALKNESITSNTADIRTWTWQSCNEFGVFTTTNTDEKHIFGSGLPTNYFLNMCYDIFGPNFTATYIRDQLIAVNSYYGGSQSYTGTNVVFTYAELDPIYTIGKTESDQFSVVSYFLQGCSSGQEMFPQTDPTNYFINTAHDIMNTNIYNWVNNPINPVTYVNSTDIWTRPSEFFGSVRAQRTDDRFATLPDDVPSKKTYTNTRKIFIGRPPHGFLPEPDMHYGKEYTYPPDYEVGTFRQPVDHFDNQNPNVFQQKYYKNAQWAKTGGPNFIMIGAEGPESEKWVLNENLTYLVLAKKYGATVYLLEHRYYGDSTIGKNIDLRQLTSLQMLYDLADFIRSVNAKTSNPAPWITFGGSYSGVLSAWMREVFPDLVTGAVASSAPVFVKLDFYEYLVVVENSIRRYNNTCAENIKSAFATMQNLFLTKEGRANLSTTFTLDPPFGDTVSQRDQHFFFSNIYTNFQLAVQYNGANNGPYSNGYGIAEICKVMLNITNTPLQNVAQYNQIMTEFYQGSPFVNTPNRYQDMINSLKDAPNHGPDSAGTLLWMWQTCTEFGYFQSTDYGYGMFGSPTPVSLYTQICIDLFDDIDISTIQGAIVDTNWRYGSRDKFRGTNVVFPNGDMDPWHVLGLYNSPDPSVVPILIDGTAHCADMYPARDSDAPGLKAARDLIDANIAKWLGAAGQTSVAPTTISVVTGNPQNTTAPPPATTTKDASIISRFLVLIVAFYTFI